MALNLDPTDLETLGLTIEELETLTKEEQTAKIKKAYKKLAVIHHPDKGGDPDVFTSIQSAYSNVLNTAEIKSDHDIHNYYTKVEGLNTSLTTFDMQMRDGIAQAFEDLRFKFMSLHTEHEKRAFATHYATFLTLVQELENNHSEFINVAQEELSKQQDQTLQEFQTLEIRKLIIRLFGEELLDDFKYREALAFGDLLPILAMRKMLSPVKWIAAITGVINLLLNGTAEYYLKHSCVNTSLLFYALGSFIATINFAVNLLACPVNSMVRPLTEWSGYSPALVSAVLSAILATTVYAFAIGAISLSLASLATTLPFLNLAINLFTFYPLIQLAQNLNNVGQNGTSTGVIIGVGILLNCLCGINPIVDFAFAVAGFSFIDTLKDMSQGQSINDLPLPEEIASSEVKNSTLLGYKQAKVEGSVGMC
jgi:hypothetical protein